MKAHGADDDVKINLFMGGGDVSALSSSLSIPSTSGPTATSHQQRLSGLSLGSGARGVGGPLLRSTNTTAGGGGGGATDTEQQPTNLQAFLRSEKDRLLTNLIDETLKTTMEDAERAHWRQLTKDWDEHKKLLCKGIPSVNVSQMVPSPSKMAARTGPRRSPMTDLELLFAKSVSECVDAEASGGSQLNFVDTFKQVAEIQKESSFVEFWDQVKAVLGTRTSSDQPLQRQRQSKEWCLSLIKQSTTYLELQFFSHMELVVRGNLEQARRGGVPGTLELVKAYLNVRLPTPYAGFEDGLYGNQYPVWAVVYHCLRCGDLEAARAVCEQGRLAEFGGAIRETGEVGSLSSDTETKLRLEYRRKVSAGRDPYKRAVYCIVSSCDTDVDHPEVAGKLEDWLWMRLRFARRGEMRRGADGTQQQQQGVPKEDNTLASLQRIIAVDYGEQHFAGSPLMYWSALWLSGLLERAIEFLFRQTLDDRLRTHAVHAAIAAHHAGLLLTPKEVVAKLLSSEPDDGVDSTGGSGGVVCRLNLVRVIMSYVSKFEATDPKEALDYLFFLRHFRSPTSGETLLEAGVARLMALTKEYELLVGSIDATGKRHSGLVDRLGVNTARLISHAAREHENSGDTEIAIKLFDLAGSYNDAIRLLNMHLSQVISQPSAPGSSAERTKHLAVTLAMRYRKFGYKADKHLSATLFLLLDFGTFFDLYHDGRYGDALDVVRKLDCLPLDPEEVDGKVRLFHMVPEEVRRVLSDILLAVMNMCVEQYKQTKQFTTANRLEQQVISDIRAQAQAVLLFAGMIPYRLPADTNARLVQLSASLN